jgi:hypothetical protein
MRLLSVLFILSCISSGALAQEETSYMSNVQMRGERKVGLGTQLGGSAGLIGINLDLNIEDQDGAVVGLGMGSGYSTFSLFWKHSFEGKYFTPYTTLGWSRWYNSAGGSGPQSHVLDGTLNQSEKDSGRFGIDFLAAAGGLQFNELSGELAGAGFFGEVELFASPFRGGLIPSAAIGVNYFF